MRITVVAVGSRGDTQPFVALAQRLSQAGHTVRVCAGDNFADFITGYGLEFAPLGVDMHYVVNVRMPEVLESGRNIIQTLRTIAREGMVWADQMWEGVQAACVDSEALVANILGVGAYNIAERRGIPLVWVYSVPMVGRTRTAPPMLFPIQRDLGPVNRLTHRLMEFGIWQAMRRPVNKWRRESRMEPLPFFGWPFDKLRGRLVPTLYGHSPAVLPKPIDWPTHYHTTGYWFLDAPEQWQPPDHLVDFLDSGPAPIYIGFGSMSNREPEEVTEIVLAALKKSGQRGLLFTGWGGVSASDMPDDVLLMERAPHDWIFPRMAGVVHHGGVGTTAAGFRAGVPTLVVPFFGDQFFWGRKAHELGVGVQPVPRKKLDGDRLATAIQQLTEDESIRQRAAHLGQRIRAEDGCGKAVGLIDRYVRIR